jgi:hypothetical protein
MGARLAIPVLSALVVATPAFAAWAAPFNVDPAGLADTAEPGSVLVWPKFVQGEVTVDAGLAGQAQEDRTTIELGAVCPANWPGGFCPEGTPVKVRLHWVCPALEGVNSQICQETDFDVRLTVNGKATFNPGAVVNGVTVPITDTGDNTVVTPAPCPMGYLIGWAESTSDVPIAFNGLIGDVIQRNTPTDLQAESALAIQADPAIPVGTRVPRATPVGLGWALPFDGQDGGYAAVTGQFLGDVRYTDDLHPPFNDGSLIVLTLDVFSNLINSETTAALDFFNEKEAVTSTAIHFICWGQFQLTAIDPSLTVEGQGTRKGIVISGQAQSQNPFTGAIMPATMLAFFQDTESPVTGPVPPGAIPFQTRSYTLRTSNNSIPVPTVFEGF